MWTESGNCDVMWTQHWARRPWAWYYHLFVVFSWWFGFRVLHSVLFCFSFTHSECLSGSWPLCRLSVRSVLWSWRVSAWQNSEAIKRLVSLTFSNYYWTLPLAEKQKANETAWRLSADEFAVVSVSMRLWALESRPPRIFISFCIRHSIKIVVYVKLKQFYKHTWGSYGRI